jgi:CheY-like chemotaxis protein
LARKILLADDSVTAQNMGRKILADAGYDVSTVNNGSAALKRIAEIKPDLIVLDVYMPGYSGLEVCQRLKDAEETAHIPVLLTVGKLEPFKPEEARRVRADAHIVKPFEASELLTAITRLEDRMVPQNSEGGRKWETSSDPDNGWKSRLGFPSKKKKEEKEEPEDLAVGSFRDFRKGKNKTGTGAFPGKSTPAGQEPGLVPDIPRDITPEELDALSALAAKLDGPRVAAENVAPPADRTSSVTTVAEVATQAIATAAEAKVEEKREEKTTVEVSAPAVEPATPVVETAALAIEGKGEVVIPVEHLEPATVSTAVVADAVAAERHQHQTEEPATQRSAAQVSEPLPLTTPAAVIPVALDTPLLAQEFAPVDRNDEPAFAKVASAVEQAAEEKIEAQPVVAAAKSETAIVDAVAAKDQESKSDPSKNQDLSAEELPAEKAAQPVPVSAVIPETALEAAPSGEENVRTPSDEELAQALRLLTPATGHAGVSASSQPSLAAAGPRWVAEPIALSREDAAISLEAEMFRTFAATAATLPAAVSGGDLRPVAITGVSAIAAAVENRLAEAELAASAKASSEQGVGRDLSNQNSEIRPAETSAVEAPAEVMAAISNTASPVFDEIAPETVAEKLAPEKPETEQTNSAAKVPEEAPVEEIAPATFADAVGQDELEAATQPNAESFSGTTAAVAEENQDTSSEDGGQESMGNVKSKSGKSNWHQIRTTPAGAAATSGAAETAEAPKAMAAAAAEGSPSSSSATDASTIAGIVDSVMADLRPKIVEEIAKRLAGK